MRTLLLAVALLCAVVSRAGAAPKTEGEFTKALELAFQEKSTAKVDSLYYNQGLSAEDKAQRLKHTKEALEFDSGQLESVTLVPLPDDFDDIRVGHGKRVEMVHKADGMVKLATKEATGSSSSLRPYAIIQGEYYLLSPKMTDLGWKGPEDHQLSVKVNGARAGSVKIKMSYNASGVMLQRKSNAQFSAVVGQYYEEVTLVCDDPQADLTMTILDRDKEIYTSEPLKGVGKLVYQRKK